MANCWKEMYKDFGKCIPSIPRKICALPDQKPEMPNFEGLFATNLYWGCSKIRFATLVLAATHLLFILHHSTSNNMITVIIGTNRANSRTSLVAEFVADLLREKAEEPVQVLDLKDLPADFVHAAMYSPEGQSPAVAALQDQYLIGANKWFIVVPEYNGGIPGIFKLFLDACSIREYKATFHGGKKAALVGVASGRSGGLRGMEYMTGFLNYLKINVMPNKLPISTIEKLVTDNQLTDEGTIKVLTQQVEDFLAF